MSKLSLWRAICLACVLCAVTAITSPAQAFKHLLDFDGTNGAFPSSLVQGRDGNFYGTTSFGGTNNAGTVFKITRDGTLTALYNFCSQMNCIDGRAPSVSGGLVLATDGNFYGTAENGGANTTTCNGHGCGTVFRITPQGMLTTLYSFCSQTNCADGTEPIGELVLAIDGDFYGTTSTGGNSACNYGAGCGTVFRITTRGKLTTLHTFDSTDGAGPQGGLIQSADGSFYGTTGAGGKGGGDCPRLGGCGTVFKITRAGKLTPLHSFHLTDGWWVTAGLVQASDGNFYGTTAAGGACGDTGTVFKITQTGKLTTLNNCGAGGDEVLSGLMQATDGNLYGTTAFGGVNLGGTIFRITTNGMLTTLYSFSVGDGANSQTPPLQATDGNFYGTTVTGGSYNDGVVFSLSVGLGPFVTFVPDFGKVGWTPAVLGQGFTGTTGVSFNGTPAAGFVVKSDTYLTATVPAGATTGNVTVTTPSGTLTSNVPYRVRPTILSFTPTSGPVGTQVTITGVSLTQTAKVAFNGTPTTNFTVNADTQVTATVPPRAHGRGPIAITTSGGKTWSRQDFTVTQ